MKFIVFVVAISFVGFCFAQEDPGFSIELSKEEVRVGEVFEYRITVEIESQTTPKIRLPEFINFQSLSQITSQNLSYKEGVAVLNLRLEYTLLALKEGEFELPVASIEYNRNVFKSPSKRIRVQGVMPEFKKKQFERIPQQALEGGVSI